MKKSIILIILCLVAVSFLSANATSEVAPNTPSEHTLVVGMETEPKSLNSHAHNENFVLQTGHLYMGFLTFLNQENGGDIQPGIAKSWKYLTSTDLELQLRDDVYFHNGRQLTADDIVYTFEWTMNADNGSIRRNNYTSSYKSIEKTGDFTVVLHLTTPNPALLELLTYLPIVAEDTVATLNTDNPIGCGPFKVDSWDHGQQINFSKWEKYYEADSVQSSKLVLRCFQDYNALMTAFFADEVDIMLFLNTSDIAAVQSRGYSTQSLSDTGNYVSCNVLSPKLQDPKVREAIKYSLDKEELIALLQSGVGEPVSQLYAPSNVFYNKDLDWNCDLERAKKALVDAGYPNGLELEILTPNSSARTNLATVLKEQIERAGFKVTVNVQENSTMFSLWNAGNAELAVGGFGFYADPSFRTSFINSATNNNWKRYGYDNEEYNSLFAKAMSSTDQNERYQYYSKMAEKTIDESGFFMLFTSTSNCALKNNIKGFVYRGSGNSDFVHITFE